MLMNSTDTTEIALTTVELQSLTPAEQRMYFEDLKVIDRCKYVRGELSFSASHTIRRLNKASLLNSLRRKSFEIGIPVTVFLPVPAILAILWAQPANTKLFSVTENYEIILGIVIFLVLEVLMATIVSFPAALADFKRFRIRYEKSALQTEVATNYRRLIKQKQDKTTLTGKPRKSNRPKPWLSWNKSAETAPQQSNPADETADQRQSQSFPNSLWASHNPTTSSKTRAETSNRKPSPPSQTNSWPQPEGARPSSPSSQRSRSAGSEHNISRPGETFESFIDQDQKHRIAENFNWVCQLCLGKINKQIPFDYRAPHPDRLDIDHIVPRSKGGSDHISNLQPVHHRCNLIKGGRLISNEVFRAHQQLREEFKTEQAQNRDNRNRSFSTSPPRSSSNRSESAKTSNFKTNRSTVTPQPNRQGLRRGQKRLKGSQKNLSETQRDRSDEFWSIDHGERLLKECQRGHEFTEENTYYSRDLQSGNIVRQCRACRRLTGH